MAEMLALPEAETEKFIEQKALEVTPVDAMSIRKLREEIKKYKSDLTAASFEEKVEEMPLENFDQSAHEENFVGVDIQNKEMEKANLSADDLECRGVATNCACR